MYFLGGKKNNNSNQGYRPLPFNYCAMSLCPFDNPCCTKEGVVFDVENLVPYLKKHNKNPCTGEKMSASEIIILTISKNDEGQWQCPVTCKTFNNNSHIVAIRKSGNIFSYDAVSELNIKAKNYTDLLTGVSFTKSDIIHIQDPQNKELVAKRDISNFIHLQQVREEKQIEIQAESKVRRNPTAEVVMKELEKRKAIELESGEKSKSSLFTSVKSLNTSDNEDVAELLLLGATTNDANPGQNNTTGQSSASLTSSSVPCWTGNKTRLANAEELREARYRAMKKLGKKGYVQLQTSHGNINLEIHCDYVHRASWNFIKLCQNGYYDGTLFHRLVPGFMLQGGDPTGTGKGGQSAWGKPFIDEFNTPFRHSESGILSMANSGPGTNKSQFFITFNETSYLDLKHTVFGKVVGGAKTLNRIQEIGTDKNERPLTEIKIIKTEVFTNPIDEANELLKQELIDIINKRIKQETPSALPKEILNNKVIEDKKIDSVGKYMKIPETKAKISEKIIESNEDIVNNFLKNQPENVLNDNNSNNDIANKKFKPNSYSNFSSW